MTNKKIFEGYDFQGNPIVNASGIPTVTIGAFSARPTSTGSFNYYWATDDCGGTAYLDDPNGGGTSIPGWRLIQTPKSELAMLELTASSAAIGSTFTSVLAAPAVTLVNTRDLEVVVRSTIQNSTADQIDARIYCTQAQNGYLASSYIATTSIPAAAVTAAVDTGLALDGLVTLPAGTWNLYLAIRAPNTGAAKLTAANNVATGKQYPRISVRLR